ncbi:MAG: protoporphyrinogen oxidase [Planctomycetaceae bacterium]|nr:protoporphyrinogen oxidase [Planctomycetaceae bacterium]
MHIAILGAGTSGLAAAYRLHQLMPQAVIRVFERRNRTGGVLETLQRDGFQIEQSADNFITTVPWGLDLCKALGLGDQLVQTNPKARRTYVVRKGKLHLLPDGFLMMAPTKLMPMATTPILSPLGKLRAGLELLIPSRKDDIDESMAAFVRRRLGREVFERLVEPLVSGVYAADMEKLSVLATLPRFRDMERQYGSLIWAMQRQLKANKAANLAEQSGARYSMFVTLRNGLSGLCEAMANRLPAGSLQLGTEVTQIDKTPEGKWMVKVGCRPPGGNVGDSRLAPQETFGCSGAEYRTLPPGGRQPTSQNESQLFDAVIAAASVADSSKVLHGSLPVLAEKLGQIEHEGTAIATFAFDSAQVKQEFRGMGFVVPKIEQSPILAGSFSSVKYEHRAPQGKFLIRVFAGGARAPELAVMPEEQLVPLLLQELRKVVHIEGEPHFTTVAHWPNTMPQYNVGHRERIQEIESLVAKEPSLALAGNAFSGVGIPNCIHTGFVAAEKIARLN